jgi:hypothetical protein
MNGHAELTPHPRGTLVRRYNYVLLMLAALVGIADAQTPQQQDAARRAAEEKAAREAELARRKAIDAAKAQAVQFAVAPAQTWTDEQFEQWMFQNALARQNVAGNANAVRQRLESQLTLHVESIDRACQLTDDQKKKIQLVGRGDIKRFFDGVEKAKEKFRAVNNDINRLQEIMPDITPLQSAMQMGLYHDDSLLRKALPNTLTAEQFPRYEEAERERGTAQHRATVDLVVNSLEKNLPLPDAQRRDLIALLMKETKPVRKPGNYDYYVMMIQMGRPPVEGKLKALFTDSQWRVMNLLLDQGKNVEPTLRQMGVLADDDPAKAADPPPRPFIDWQKAPAKRR